MYLKQKCLFNALLSTVLIWQICMGHLITSKEVVKYFLRAVNLLLVGLSLKIRFSSRKQYKSLSRAAWYLQSQSGSGRDSGFAVSDLGVAHRSTEPPEFTDSHHLVSNMLYSPKYTSSWWGLGKGLLLSSDARFLGRIPSRGRWFITILHESKLSPVCLEYLRELKHSPLKE